MRKLALLVVVVALVSAACSSAGSGVIGTVGGVNLTEADIGEFFESDSLAIDDAFREATFALFAREVLLQGLLADFGLALDEEAVTERYTELLAQMEQAGSTPEEFIGVPDASTEMLRFNAEVGVIRRQAIDGLILQPETLEAFFSDEVAFTTVCVRHLLVESVEEAEIAIGRLDEGEDFATLATEISRDTGTPGGDLGCALAGQYVPEFARATIAADIGTLFGPVETQFGFHVLVVDERTAPTAEELQADPQAYLTEAEIDTLWSDWFNETLRAADVVLDAKYGSWSPVGIVPPGDAEPVPTEE